MRNHYVIWKEIIMQVQLYRNVYAEFNLTNITPQELANLSEKIENKLVRYTMLCIVTIDNVCLKM